jgi:hypothetical protein
MNERIRELALQAKEYARGFNYQHEVFEKKFAELIVKECLNQLQELVPPKVAHEHHQELVDVAHAMGIRVGAAKIKQHFGVEE